MVTTRQILWIATWTTLILVLWLYLSHSPQPLSKVPRVIPLDDLGHSDANGGNYRRQRDRLSTMLNSVKHQLALLSCELVDVKTQHNQSTSLVSANGGWCKNASQSGGGRHQMDKALARALIPLFQNCSVASFGDGPGDYKKYMDASLALKSYHAFDGAPYSEENSDGAVKFMDLTAPQYGLPVFDWVMSLEVAEHIPQEYEDIYVDNVVRHARVGIILSWATPYQSGFSHVNTRTHKFVERLLSSKGFDVDQDTSVMLQSKAKVSWLKRNVFVYKRTGNPPHINDA